MMWMRRMIKICKNMKVSVYMKMSVQENDEDVYNVMKMCIMYIRMMCILHEKGWMRFLPRPTARGLSY